MTAWRRGFRACCPLPIGFAHRGGQAHATENTLEAFRLAIDLGATGIETDAWITADDQIVLLHDGVVGRRPWLPGWPILGRPVVKARREQLPRHVPTLDDYYRYCGSSMPLSIDVKDADAFDRIVAVARDNDAADRLWVCHGNLDVLAEWRQTAPDVRLVHSAWIEQLPGGPERHAADLARLGVDAVNLWHGSWGGGLVALYHRFDVLAFGWDAQQSHHIEELIDSGIDAVYSDHVNRLTEALNRFAD